MILNFSILCNFHYAANILFCVFNSASAKEVVHPNITIDNNKQSSCFCLIQPLVQLKRSTLLDKTLYTYATNKVITEHYYMIPAFDILA